MNRLHGGILAGAVLCLLVGTPLLQAASKSGVDPQVISLPKGPGSIEGLGESFEPQLNTGTATYRVKIGVAPGVNKQQPEVALEYNSGYGNSPVGIGWSLNTEFIQRQTDKGVPGYTDTDTFIYSRSGELVPIADGTHRFKNEGPFMRFRKNGDSWEAWEKDGTHLYFGTTASGRVNTRLGTFAWYIERSVDTNGNEIRYLYETDGGQIYLSEIRYSIISPSVRKSVLFSYESRPDPFTDYHSRSKILTARRLFSIEVRSAGSVARSYLLGYKPGGDFSLLERVTQYGTDGITALPPLTFTYTAYSTEHATTVVMQDPPPAGISPVNDNADLVDIDGDSLPDLVHTDSVEGTHRFYLNLGSGVWQAAPVLPESSPQHLLATDGVMMSDMNGDGLADLFVKSPTDFGYYRNIGGLKWEEGDWVPCTPNPAFSFESAQIRLLDVNNDKLVDVIYDAGDAYRIWLNKKDNHWSESFDLETTLPEGSHLSFLSGSTELADMNGDRMEDLVHVVEGAVAYFPNMGNGEFDAQVDMENPPSGLGPGLAGKLMAADINNDGLSDFVLVGNGAVTVWFNAGHDAFKDSIDIAGTPGYVEGLSAIRPADMNGDGFRDLLVTDEGSTEGRYQYVDFNQGVHPNLLSGIANGLGMETSISYRSSTEFYLDDRDAGRPWNRKMPFPVQVVSSVKVKDLNGGQEYVTDYLYRNGYYDGAEKEFRGFGEVRKVERGGPGAPTLVSYHAFDVGDVEESRKGMVKTLATLGEDGTLSPPAGLFDRQDSTLQTRQLLTGTNGVPVKYSFTRAQDLKIYEGTTAFKLVSSEADQDSYGRTTWEARYGLVEGANKAVGNDEVVTSTEYLTDLTNWILDRPTRVANTGLTGGFVSLQRSSYDARGNLTLQEDSPDGTTFIPTLRNEYDGYGNIVKITDANDHWRSVGYDAVFHTFPVSETIGGLGLTLTAGYDTRLGVVASFVDFNGNQTTFGYDPLGRLTSIVKPGDSSALPTQVFSYLLANPVSSVTTRSREVSGAPGTLDNVSYYDGLGRKLQTRSEGESDNWVVADAVIFNARKGVARKSFPYFAGSSEFGAADPAQPYTALEYDPKGRSVKEINPDGSFKSTRYDPLAKVVSDEEDNGSGVHVNTPHTFVSDGLERLVEVRERNGAETYVTRYGYDGQGNLVRITDAAGNVKTMVFDGLGRKTSMDDPDKHHMAYVYDPVGNIISTTDAKSQTVTYAYDEVNRILTETFAGEVKVRYHYDGDLAAKYPGLANTLGKMSWVEDEAGREYLSYDSRGNVAQRYREAGGYTFMNVQAYDAMDRVTRFTYPDGASIEYVYNSMGQLEAIPGFVTNIDYAPTGRKTRFVYANGVESQYEYDQRQRLTNLASRHNETVLQDLDYTYDQTSNIAAISDQRPVKTLEDLSRTFVYDDLYRLTQATAPAWTEAYQYSSIGNMTFKTDMGTMLYGGGGAGPHAVTKAVTPGIDYGYDANGNLKNKNGFTYRFDHRDRLVRANRLADGAVIDFAYDYRGNRVTKSTALGVHSDTSIYVDRYTELRNTSLIRQVFTGNRMVARIFDAFNPVTLIQRVNPLGIAEFDVNPKDGVISLQEIRVQGDRPDIVELQDVKDALTIYLGSHEEDPEILSYGTIARAMHESSASESLEESTVYLLPDHLGGTAAATDAAGMIIEEITYTPYGTEDVSGMEGSVYRFLGKELDKETGLYYFGARYYDSLTAGFVSTDPLLLDGTGDQSLGSRSLNTYSYPRNPIKLVDRDGLFWAEALSTATNAATSAGRAVVDAAEEILMTPTRAIDCLSDQMLKYVVGNDIGNLDSRAQAAAYASAADSFGKIAKNVGYVKKGLDISVDILANFTGPVGQAVKYSYKTVDMIVNISGDSVDGLTGREASYHLGKYGIGLAGGALGKGIKMHGQLTGMSRAEVFISKQLLNYSVTEPLKWAWKKGFKDN